MSNDEEILKRLERLELENARLRKLAGGNVEPKKTETVVSMFKGHPVITFTGSFRPFSLGLRKVIVILEKLAEMKHFLENNRQHLPRADDAPEPPV